MSSFVSSLAVSSSLCVAIPPLGGISGECHRRSSSTISTSFSYLKKTCHDGIGGLTSPLWSECTIAGRRYSVLLLQCIKPHRRGHQRLNIRLLASPITWILLFEFRLRRRSQKFSVQAKLWKKKQLQAVINLLSFARTRHLSLVVWCESFTTQRSACPAVCKEASSVSSKTILR